VQHSTAQHSTARCSTALRSAHACAHDAALHADRIGSDRIDIVRVVGASSQQATTTCNDDRQRRHERHAPRIGWDRIAYSWRLVSSSAVFTAMMSDDCAHIACSLCSAVCAVAPVHSRSTSAAVKSQLWPSRLVPQPTATAAHCAAAVQPERVGERERRVRARAHVCVWFCSWAGQGYMKQGGQGLLAPEQFRALKQTNK
jgi:hypothetical protein